MLCTCAIFDFIFIASRDSLNGNWRNGMELWGEEEGMEYVCWANDVAAIKGNRNVLIWIWNTAATTPLLLLQLLCCIAQLANKQIGFNTMTTTNLHRHTRWTTIPLRGFLRELHTEKCAIRNFPSKWTNNREREKKNACMCCSISCARTKHKHNSKHHNYQLMLTIINGGWWKLLQ